MIKHLVLSALVLFFCSQTTPARALNIVPQQRLPRAALVAAVTVFHQVTSRGDFDLFRAAEPKDAVAFACAALLFFYLICELTNRRGTGLGFLCSFIGVIAIIFNTYSWRFVVPFIMFLIIGLERHLLARVPVNH